MVLQSVSELVCFGDSITEGYLVPFDSSYPSVLSRLLSISCHNLGVSGETSFDGLKRFKQLASYLGRAHRVGVLIEFGINDFFMGFSKDQFGLNLSTMVERILSAGQLPIILGFKLNYLEAVSWSSVFEDTALRFSVPFYPNVFDGLANIDGAFLSDGLHPSVVGYKEMAKNIGNFLLSKKIIVNNSNEKRI